MDDKPIISLIALLRTPRNLDEAIILQCIPRALPKPPSADSAPWARRLPGKPCYAVFAIGLGFGVIDSDKPYFNDIARAADATKDVLAKLAIQQHTSWLAVDFMRNEPNLSEARIYGLLGKLLVELLDEDPLALARSPDGKIVGYDPSFRKLLLAGNAQEIFRLGSPDKIIQTPPSDAELAAATEQAKQRWPEFLTAFSQRQKGHGFGVKKAFEENGKVEHMWVEVLRIAGHTIHGRLANAPRDIPSLKLGDPVSLDIDDLEDWMFTRGKQSTGGFQIPILQRRQKPT